MLEPLAHPKGGRMWLLCQMECSNEYDVSSSIADCPLKGMPLYLPLPSFIVVRGRSQGQLYIHSG